MFLNLLGNLAFPLLLVGGLFLLSRRGGGAGGMGGPGGNNPLAFGELRTPTVVIPNTFSKKGRVLSFKYGYSQCWRQ